MQPIDTARLIYEAKVGQVKLIVSSADLRLDAIDRPAVSQLFYSIQKYMASDAFNPKTDVSFEVVKDVFFRPSKNTIHM